MSFLHVSKARDRAFKVFLSHRYKSPETNLFFFGVFAGVSELQFEVDAGQAPTNVTRLERMIRGADAFVGIYPYPLQAQEALTQEDLLRESRYFRLELDLAIRSSKPTLICYDQRYRNVLACTAATAVITFDSQEVAGRGSAPSAERYRKVFRDFCQTVAAAKAYQDTKSSLPHAAKVGVLLPASTPAAAGYEQEHFTIIEALLAEANYEPVRIPCPPVLERRLFDAAAELDWIIVDVGDAGYAAAVAYFHGQFMPTMRLKRCNAGDLPSALEQILYGGVEAGYKSDTLRWQTGEELRAGVRARIKGIDLPTRRIGSHQQAKEYFSSAALRKEAVFVSYSGKDEKIAATIVAALGTRFQRVFDYRDGHSIRPGAPWMEEIFAQLSAAAVAIPLLSAAYFESGNCKHEAQVMTAAHDSGKLRILPVKVSAEKLVLPSWFPPLQYERAFLMNDEPERLAVHILDLVTGLFDAPKP